MTDSLRPAYQERIALALDDLGDMIGTTSGALAEVTPPLTPTSPRGSPNRPSTRGPPREAPCLPRRSPIVLKPTPCPRLDPRKPV
jgi:hypothetical protein